MGSNGELSTVVDKLNKEIGISVLEKDISNLNVTEYELPKIIIKNGKISNREEIDSALLKFNNIKKEFAKKIAEFKEYTKSINDKIKEVSSAISEKEKKITDDFTKFYTTKTKITRKINDVEIAEEKLLDEQVQFIKTGDKKDFIYDEAVLMLNPRFVKRKTTKTLERLKVKEEYKKYGSVEGLTVIERKEIKFKEGE